MSKQKTPRTLADNEAKATIGIMKTSPQKLNLIAQMIRGLPVDQALEALAFSKKRSAKEVRKLLSSVVANAENNHQLDVDSLVVAQAYVGKAFTLKRMMARARGRGGKILKRFSRMTVVVREVEVA